nr:MAG TPA: hypothetical protein [Caudoviricetes sp.]
MSRVLMLETILLRSTKHGKYNNLTILHRCNRRRRSDGEI